MKIGTDDAGCDFCEVTTVLRDRVVYICDGCGKDCCSGHCYDDGTEVWCDDCWNDNEEAPGQ